MYRDLYLIGVEGVLYDPLPPQPGAYGSRKSSEMIGLKAKLKKLPCPTKKRNKTFDKESLYSV